MKHFPKGSYWILIFFCLILPFSLPSPALAAEIDNDGRLAASEIVEDDLLTTATNVSIDGTVEGNLLAIGQTVTINGTIAGDAVIAANTVVIGEKARVEGNLMVASSSIVVAGKIEGSIFGASTALTLRDSSEVIGNVYYAGYSISTDQGSHINKDLFTAVYQVVLNGTLTRDAQIAAAAVEVGGAIGRNVRVELGESDSTIGESGSLYQGMPFLQQPGVPAAIQPGLRVSESAVIGGTLAYTALQDHAATINAEPVNGIVFSTPTPMEEDKGLSDRSTSGGKDSVITKFLGWLWKSMRDFITLVVLGLLVAWKLAPWLDRSMEKLREKPLESAGYGFVSLLLGYSGTFFFGIGILMVGIVISIFTLGGLSQAVFGVGFSALALAFSIFSLLVFFGSKLVVAALIGHWSMKLLSPANDPGSGWRLMLGVILYSIPASLPFIGWIFAFAATLFGMGAVWLAVASSKDPETLQEI